MQSKHTAATKDIQTSIESRNDEEEEEEDEN